MTSVLHVLVTEPTSSLAYQLLPILASGDVIRDQKLVLVLCDGENAQSEAQEVANELKDCTFPSLAGVCVTSDFCEACKAADVVIVLPRGPEDRTTAGSLDVAVSYSMLTQIDFPSLNSGLHPCLGMHSVKCRGVLSAARSVCSYISDLHQHSLKAAEREIQVSQEEAEFGRALDLSGPLWQCDYHLNMNHSPVYDRRTLLVLVNAHSADVTSTYENIYENRRLGDTIPTSPQIYARL